MKKISILLVAVAMIFTANAQKDVAASTAGAIAPLTQDEGWKFDGGLGLFGNQVALVNWAAGGISAFSGIAKGDISANMKKGKLSWENKLEGEWGFIKEKEQIIKKNVDALKLNSKIGYQLDKKGKLYVGALLSFNSLFSPYFVDDMGHYSSNFLAPADMIVAAGLDWKPNKSFSLFFSPIASKMIFVMDKGVDETAYGLEEGATSKFELGAYMKAEFKKELMKNVKFKTGLVLYTNYLDNSIDAIYDEDNKFIEDKSNFGNIDIDWYTGLDLTVNKWITVGIGTQLIYDHDTKINLTEEVDEKTVPILSADGTQATGPRVQFREALNIGITYRFTPKKKK